MSSGEKTDRQTDRQTDICRISPII